MAHFIKKYLACPFTVLMGIAGISAFSLAAALTAEIMFGLEPCILCIYQRIPFVVALLLSLLGLIMLKINKDSGKTIAPWIIAINAIAFLINSIIALYHSGVELKWWRSAVEGCAVPSFGDKPQSLLENILSAPTSRCDEIPWADPILNLSMANYNVAWCFGLFALCALSFILLKQRPSHS